MFESAKRVRRSSASWLLVLCCVCAVAFAACRRDVKQPTDVPKTPSVRLFIASTLAGAMEPCGCRKDMLGGVDHAAALIADGRKEAEHSVVLGAGPVFFLDPELAPDKRQQDVWKAHSIAASLADMQFAAWSPGLNDFAAGLSQLSQLSRKSGAKLLAANVTIEGVETSATRIIELGKHKLGITGVADWSKGTPLPAGVTVSEPIPALQQAQQALRDGGATILVALVSAQRGQALRLAEVVTGYHVVVVGKPLDRGEGNDAPTPPVTIGSTLVVQGPNHLQSLAVVDLYVRGDQVAFSDGTGIASQEKKVSLQRRIAELSTRIAMWKERGQVDQRDIAARQRDLEQLQREYSALDEPVDAPPGSFFRYDLRDVREKYGSNEQVLARMRDYYKKVNEHNRQAFADRKPRPVAEGEAGYVGGQKCAECHDDADAFWKTTGHAGAYETLEVDFKEFNLDCVSCHVTGYERPGGSTVTFVEGLKDVQCESCHGPGSLHVDDESGDTITLTPAESVCKKCHHPPHVADDWDVKEAWQHIIGEGHGGSAEVATPALGAAGSSGELGEGGQTAEPAQRSQGADTPASR